jgi:hypothetical protein
VVLVGAKHQVVLSLMLLTTAFAAAAAAAAPAGITAVLSSSLFQARGKYRLNTSLC